MTYAYIHLCRHVDEYNLLDSQVSREATFSKADTLIPAFVETCCSAYECQHIEPISLPYTPDDLQHRIIMVNAINCEFDRCSKIITEYNDSAEHHNLSPILLAEFEHLLIRVYNWVTRAEEFANDNGPRFFHDVCLAIAETTLHQIVAMRLSIRFAVLEMPAPETAPVVRPDDIPSTNIGLPQLRDLCPDLLHHALKLSYTPKVDYGIAHLPQDYSSFESTWRSRIKYIMTHPRP